LSISLSDFGVLFRGFKEGVRVIVVVPCLLMPKDFSDASVREITLAEAREFMHSREWLENKLGNASRAFGLFFGNRLGAVEVFGHPGSPAILNICGPEHRDKVAWLARGARARWAPRNAGSYLIARACRLMSPKCVFLATADSDANEQGYIYRANNWMYLGKSSADRMFKKRSHPRRKARSYRVLVRGPIRSRVGRVETPDADGRRHFLIGGRKYYRGDKLPDGSRVVGSDSYPHLLRKTEKARLREVLAEGYVRVKGNPKHVYVGIYGDRRLRRRLRAALTKEPLPYPKRPIARRRRTPVYSAPKEVSMDARAFLDQLLKERSELDSLIAGVQKRLGGSQSHASAKASPKGAAKHGRTWSPAARAAMSRKLKQVIAQKKHAAEARSRAAKKAASTRKPKAAKPAAKATAA
jgi:hypothetical protein